MRQWISFTWIWLGYTQDIEQLSVSQTEVLCARQEPLVALVISSPLPIAILTEFSFFRFFFVPVFHFFFCFSRTKGLSGWPDGEWWPARSVCRAHCDSPHH